MDLRPRERDLLASYVAPFTELAGDRRTGRLLGDVVGGIIGSESLVCSRIAAFSPRAGREPQSAERIRRMLHGETTKRADLDPDRLVARLQARGVERLRGEPRSGWSSTARTCASRTPRDDGAPAAGPGGWTARGTVPGYATLNAHRDRHRRQAGLALPHAFSSTAPGSAANRPGVAAIAIGRGRAGALGRRRRRGDRDPRQRVRRQATSGATLGAGDASRLPPPAPRPPGPPGPERPSRCHLQELAPGCVPLAGSRRRWW